MMLPQGMGLHVPVLMHVGVCSCLGTPLSCCTDLHGLSVTACLHGQEPTPHQGHSLICSIRPVAGVWSKLIPLPAVGRGARSYRLSCLSPAGQRGPGSSGFRLQAGSVVEQKRLVPPLSFPPTSLNEHLHSGALGRRQKGVPWCIAPLRLCRVCFYPQLHPWMQAPRV